MPAEALKCKECSTTYPLEARYVCERCFGPLEVAYRPPGSDADELKRRIQAGPHTLWRYADFLPLERVAAQLAADRLDAARARRPARRAARHRRALDQERDRQPDALVQGPRRLGRARARDRARASTPSRAPRPATSPAPSPRTPPTPGCPPTSSSRPTSSRRRSSPPAPTARRSSASAATTTPSTGSAPRSRASARAGRSSTSTCGPYYAEGSKTLAFETAEQLGWELPDRVVAPIASGSLFTKVARGFQEFIDAGPASTASCRRCTARRPRAARRSRRRSRRAPTSAAPSSPTRSPSRSRSATRPTARTPSSSRAAPAARSTRSPTTRSAPASGCSPRRPASSPRRPAA